MKQFILKNIVLAVILALTLVGSIVLMVFCEGKRRTVTESMATIDENARIIESIDSARKPNSVEESETKIKADTEVLSKKNVQIYRHFGKPYRPALLKLLKNIASPAELKVELPLDPSLVAKPKPKVEPEEGEEEGEEEVADAKPATPEPPTDEEKAVFECALDSGNMVKLDPETKQPADVRRVVLSFDEDTLRGMLADLYKEIHQESEDDTFVIPDTIQSERSQLFEKLFNQIIEAPEVVNPARAEDFRKAAAAKFAQAFAIFREDVQAHTLENVNDRVAHELFLDALGLPRLMRQRDCKNYIDFLYEKYLASDVIPGLPEDDPIERERLVQDFIYGKNLNRQALPVPEMVIPIIRNFQIKEDLFRRMKDAGIKQLLSMNAGVFYGSTMDSDAEGPILSFTYTLEMTASMDAINAFINSLQGAYKTDRVYVINDIKFSAPYEDLINANAVVASHTDSLGTTVRRTTAQGGIPGAPPADNNATQQQTAAEQAAAALSTSTYDLTDPHHPEYGKVLVGEVRDEIKCTIVVNYLFYRADNITPQ
ncbi:MAG: hypothetical protein IJT68_00585 [Lentisphaeria bacterium]|nr:hypothetical protein [Lentisphaeria bacterium]